MTGGSRNGAFRMQIADSRAHMEWKRELRVCLVLYENDFRTIGSCTKRVHFRAESARKLN